MFVNKPLILHPPPTFPLVLAPSDHVTLIRSHFALKILCIRIQIIILEMLLLLIYINFSVIHN